MKTIIIGLIVFAALAAAGLFLIGGEEAVVLPAQEAAKEAGEAATQEPGAAAQDMTPTDLPL